jgi:hypothetical protein
LAPPTAAKPARALREIIECKGVVADAAKSLEMPCTKMAIVFALSTIGKSRAGRC